MSVKKQLADLLSSLVEEIAPDGNVVVAIETPVQESHGDYSTNVAMILGKKLHKNPMEIAEEMSRALRANSIGKIGVEKVEVVKPGFINFWLSKEELLSSLEQSSNLPAGRQVKQSSNMSGKKIFVEYAHPNTHKEMHIGHMRTLITGEALCRLFEASGATVFRANYQGDIGPHVAKALYGIQKIMEERKLALSEVEGWSNKDKAHFLGEGYVRGNQEYEEHKEEIDGINTELYAFIVRHSGDERSEDSRIGSWTSQDDEKKNWSKLYQLTRKWSLDYYDEFYTRFYTKYDKLFFESEVAEAGKKIVLDHIGKVFVEENGAVIFPGEKYVLPAGRQGLHTRVFITQAGNPTYEGKEMGNAYAEHEEFPFDLKMHIVASEQAGYFQVVFKALELIDPEKFAAKQHHLSMGMVTLTDRKMSSRTGDILTVDWLIDQVKEKVEELAKEGKIARLAESKRESEKLAETVEMITIGAIKYSVLKGGTGQNVAFDIEKSVSLEGNSGPYLQYTFARTQSVLGKSLIANRVSKENDKPLAISHKLEAEEVQLLRKLYQFVNVISDAAEKYSPNILCTYLYELASTFNLFYQKHKILGTEQEDFRLTLTKTTGDVLQKGLDLLGIRAPEKM